MRSLLSESPRSMPSPLKQYLSASMPNDVVLHLTCRLKHEIDKIEREVT
jgi:hypothetical protein